MKILKHLLLSIVMLFMSITALAQEFQLNTKQSHLNWTGKAAFNSYSLSGSLNVKEGSAKVNKDSILSLKVVIDMKSLNHDNSDLKKHLRSEDFFEVKTYKTATFEITEPVIIENNKAVLVGNMTIKNITKKETIEVVIKDKTMRFNHRLDRTTYGIKFNSPTFFKKMKENAIADEFILDGTLHFK